MKRPRVIGVTTPVFVPQENGGDCVREAIRILQVCISLLSMVISFVEAILKWKGSTFLIW